MRIRSAAVAAALFFALTAVFAAPANAAPRAITPDPDFVPANYLGSWYQIASIPQFYDLACKKNTIATYGLNSNGTVSVDNRCISPFGTRTGIKGAAKFTDPSAPASLNVSFLKIFGKQIFTGGPNYVVLETAPDYSWAVVGHPDRISAYVLSRKPTLGAAELEQTKAILTANGYDLCKVKYSPQDGGITKAAPLC